jgi:hypothetical protein
MIARRRLAMTQWADTEHGRLWASVAAQGAGRSSRQSTRAPGVRPEPESLQADDAPASLVGLRQLHDQSLAPAGPPAGVPPALSSSGWTHGADAVEVLRWCLAWLEPWAQVDHGVVHRRPARAPATACVSCERPRVGRGLAWIVADSMCAPAAPWRVLQLCQTVSRSVARGIVSGSQSRSRRRDDCAGGKSRLPHDKRWDSHRRREAASQCTQVHARTRRAARLRRRSRDAATHHPRPVASTVCARRSL